MRKHLKSRLAALFCAVVLALSILPITAAEVVPTFFVTNAAVAQGNSCTVTIWGQQLELLHTLKLTVFYDADALILEETSYLNIDMATFNTNTAGQVQISAMDMDGVSGNQELIRLTFRAGRYAATADYPLTLVVSEVRVGSSYISMEPQTHNGLITVTEYVTPTARLRLDGSGSVQAGSDLVLRLYAENTGGLTAGQFAFTYDSQMFQLKRLQMLPDMQTDDATFSVNSLNEGMVVAAYAASTPPPAGSWLELILTALENSSGATVVTCTPSNLYDESHSAIQASSMGKEITVTERAPSSDEPDYPNVWFEMPEILGTDQSFTVSLWVQGSSRLAAADFVVSYDTAVLECISVAAAGSTSGEITDNQVTVVTDEAFGDGTVEFSMLRSGGISQDTELVEIQLRAKDNRQIETILTAEAFTPVNHDQQTVTLELVPAELTIIVPEFTVQFQDEDGTVLSTQKVPYLGRAEAPVFDGKEPDADGHYVLGWDKPFSSITEDTVVKAIYTQESHAYEEDWLNYNETQHVHFCSVCQFALYQDHDWGSWSFADMDAHSRGCTQCGAEERSPHQWQMHVCADCGQEDVYISVDGQTATIQSALMTQDGMVVAAAYDAEGKMLLSEIYQWGTEDFLAIELPQGAKVCLFFLSAQWLPLRPQIHIS